MHDAYIPEDSGSVPPSPLKPEFTTDPPFHTHKSQAIRKISFDDFYNGKELVKVKICAYILMIRNIY